MDLDGLSPSAASTGSYSAPLGPYSTPRLSSAARAAFTRRIIPRAGGCSTRQASRAESHLDEMVAMHIRPPHRRQRGDCCPLRGRHLPVGTITPCWRCSTRQASRAESPLDGTFAMSIRPPHRRQRGAIQRDRRRCWRYSTLQASRAESHRTERLRCAFGRPHRTAALAASPPYLANCRPVPAHSPHPSDESPDARCPSPRPGPTLLRLPFPARPS